MWYDLRHRYEFEGLMAVTLTLEEFRQFHPEVNAPDVVIQAYID